MGIKIAQQQTNDSDAIQSSSQILKEEDGHIFAPFAPVLTGSAATLSLHIFYVDLSRYLEQGTNRRTRGSNRQFC